MSFWCRCNILLILFCIPVVQTLHAQETDPPPQLGNTRQDTIPEGIMPLDTAVPFTYVLLGDPDKLYSSFDTLDWGDIRHYPVPGYYAHLGNYGSAARSLAPVTQKQIGFSTGWTQYDPYYIHQDQFRYYNQEIPVLKAKYSQAGQENTFLTLEFGRKFAEGYSLSVFYNRINQIGLFANQRQKDTAFGVGIWYDAPSGKYDAFYNYTNNAAVAQENGGVSDISMIGEPNFPDMSIPVYIQSGTTNHKHRSFLTKQILHLAADSADFGLDVWVQGSYATGLFKYVDELAINAPDYYGPEYLIDDRGIRQYTYMAETQLTFGVELPWRKAHSTLSGAIRYRGINLQQEPNESKISEIYLEGRGVFQWIQPLILKGGFSLGLGQAEGAFSFNAQGDLNIGPLGSLRGQWAIASRKPSLMESSLYVNQQPIYTYQYDNVFTSDLGVSWEYTAQSLQIGARWLIYDNYIFFDSISFPQQVDRSFSVRRFSVTKSFDWKAMGIRGALFWQPDPPKELAIPDVWFTAGIYGKVKILDRQVTLLPGADITYNGTLTGNTFFPVNGQFRLTNGSLIPRYFRLDIGLGLQIKFIKAFVRMEDFVGLFEKRVLYQSEIYPHYRGYFRIGLEASFFN